MRAEVIATDLARRYGIAVHTITGEIERPTLHATYGPMGHWCDTANRSVYFEPGKRIETYVHEIVHVITQPPWWHIEEVPEDFLLMPVERVIARTVLSTYSYKRVVRWQEATQAELMSCFAALSDTPNYTRTKVWRTTFALARLIGLLDRWNRPTFKMPDWKKARPFKGSLWKYIRESGETDPWGRKGAPNA